jgi:type I restriction enzyme R subunit
MWITGFDVPCLDTMYIDKPLQKHTLVQTISRVNRVYEGKDKGLVVDYIGIKTNMNNALKQYAGTGDLGDNVETIEQSLTMVKDELDILRRMFAQFDYSKFTTGTPLEQLECLKHAAEFVQVTEKTQNQFMGHTKKLKSAFNLCSNHEAITDEDRENIHFFTGVRSIIYKLTKGDAPDASQMNRKVSKMIEEALQSEGVEEVVQVNANTKDLDLLSQDYMARLEKLKLPNTKVKLMEKLLRTVITDFKKVNKMKGVDFTKRLNALVQKYNDRSDNAVFAEEVLNEVARQMAELLKEVNAEKKSFKDLGITYEEKAFYDILKEIAHKFGFEYPEEKLIPLSAAVKKMVDDKSRYTDWANRSDIKAELQMDLILILAEHGYPPVPQDDVFKEIFEQAENFKKYERAEDDIERVQSQVGLSSAEHKQVRPRGKTQEIQMIPKGSMLDDVEADDDVRRLVHNMMELYEGTTIESIYVECHKEFHERYFSMKGNDWRHLIGDYVRQVTERPDLQENEVFRYVMAG